jgi:1-acyl-sn-glycerol-3-phosphate acyltransferase
MYFEIKDFVRAAADRLVHPAVAARMARIPNRLNECGYDPWGLSPADAKHFYSIAYALYRWYFRVETVGVESIPAGRCLLVANHSGQLPVDGLMLATAALVEASPPRLLRGMVERWFPTLPFLSVIIPRLGSVLGDPKNCRDMLENDEAVMVFPEGVRGSGKTWDKAYQLQEFGLGFVRLALETGTPIVPVGIIGGEEQAVSVYNWRWLARRLGFPYFPVTPVSLVLGPIGGVLPLPTKYRIYIDEPIRFEGDPDEPDAEVRKKVEVVKSKIARLIEYGLESREGIFT